MQQRPGCSYGAIGLVGVVVDGVRHGYRPPLSGDLVGDLAGDVGDHRSVAGQRPWIVALAGQRGQRHQQLDHTLPAHRLRRGLQRPGQQAELYV